MYDVEQHREWLISLVETQAGASVVDLGCGKGADILALAARVSDPSARFLGVDASPSHVAAARTSCSDARVRFACAKVGSELAFATNSFDVVMSQELLECLTDVDSFVLELGRILRAGGQILISHYDWDTQVFNGSDRDRTRRVLRAWAEWEQSWMDNANPWMGRQLWGHLEGSGLFEGEVRVRAMTNTEFAEPWHGYRLAHWFSGLVKRGRISEEDYEGFLADLQRLAAKGRYFWSVNRYVYVGRRRAP